MCPLLFCSILFPNAVFLYRFEFILLKLIRNNKSLYFILPKPLGTLLVGAHQPFSHVFARLTFAVQQTSTASRRSLNYDINSP